MRKEVEDLCRHVQSEGQVCPMPLKWKELYEMLPDTQRVGSGWNPPLPLILAAW